MFLYIFSVFDQILRSLLVSSLFLKNIEPLFLDNFVGFVTFLPIYMTNSYKLPLMISIIDKSYQLFKLPIIKVTNSSDYQILKQPNIKSIKHGTYKILNLPNIEPTKYGSYQNIEAV